MLLTAASGGAILAGPLVAAELGMLDTLRTGSWDVRDRDTGAHSKVCVRSGRELVQMKHPGSNCERLVVDDKAANVTVQYTCRGQGYGHTQIRKESDRLIQIHTRGIESGRPFDVSAEARYTGSC
jgi:hypothetical protein